MTKRLPMARLLAGFLFLSLFSGGAGARAPGEMALKAQEALAAQDWVRAELFLGRMDASGLTPRERYGLFAKRAWVAMRLGQRERARRFADRASAMVVEGSPLDEAMLQDTRLSLRLPKAGMELPPWEERVVLFPRSFRQTFADKPFERVQEWVREQLEAYLRPEPVETPFAKPVPPRLERGEFEQTEDFIQRVEEAQQRYMDRIKAMRRSQEDARKRARELQALREKQLPRVRRLFTQYALNRFVGPARFELERYAADAEAFPGRVVLGDGDQSYDVVVSEPIHSAPRAKKRLEDARPMLVFRLGDGSLSLNRILVQASGETEPRLARLGDGQGLGSGMAAYEVPEAKLASSGGSGQGKAGEALDRLHQATEVLALNIDPEIKRLQGKLSQARSAGDRSRMAKLRAQIGQLQKKWDSTFEDDLPVLLEDVAAAPTDPDKHALVIGISEYAKTNNVPFAARSARMFALVANKVLGVPEENIQTFYDAEATGSTLATRFRYAGENLGPGERLYVYYAGHGVPSRREGGTPFLLPQDLDPGYGGLNDDLKLANVYQDLTASGEGQVVAFMDSCFSGQSDNRMVYKGAAPGLLRRAEMPEPDRKNLLVVTAGSAQQFANYYPSKGHRLFGYYLMRGLLEGKKDSDALAAYLKDRVSDVSRRLGPAYEQTPQVRGKLPGGSL